jgi:membrane protease YdiL (CAAX protease family)
VSDVEPPGIAAALALILVSGPFLVLALRRAARRLPRERAAADAWPGGQAALVLLTPLALLAVVGAFLPASVAPPAAPAPETSAETIAEPPEEPAEPDVLPAMLASQLVLGAGAGLALFLATRRPAGRAGLGLGARYPSAAPGAILLLYLPGFFVARGLGILWMHVCRSRGWDERQEILRLILSLDTRELVAAGAVAVLVAPLIEELLFRGFLQAFLAQHVGERAGLVGSSLVFASLHGMAGLPILLLLSLCLGWLQQRTRCLWVPVSLHALHNGVGLALELALHRG